MCQKKQKNARAILKGPIRGGHDLVPVLRPVTMLPADLNPQLKA